MYNLTALIAQMTSVPGYHFSFSHSYVPYCHIYSLYFRRVSYGRLYFDDDYLVTIGQCLYQYYDLYYLAVRIEQ